MRIDSGVSKMVLLAVLVEGLVAQVWVPVGSGPRHDFGYTGDLVVHASTQVIGYDELAGTTWRLVSPSASQWVAQPTTQAPSPRFGASMVAGTKPFLFGGFDAALGGPRNDIWRYDLLAGDWHLATAGVPSGPSARYGAKLAGFPATGFYLLFGGRDANGWLADTWFLFDTPGGPAWLFAPTTQWPPARDRHAMAAAPNGEVLLFGGGNPGPLGDTWLYRNGGWVPHTGPGPAPATDARLAYDAGREIDVLLHPNGETWEWNGFHWRRVGATGAPAWSQPSLVAPPAPAGGVFAFQASAVTLDRWEFQPSPAAYDSTFDLLCGVGNPFSPRLVTVDRSVPVLGQPLHLRVVDHRLGVLVVGAFELAQPLLPTWILPGCGCPLGLTGIGTAAQWLPGAGTSSDWFLPIANLPVLHGQHIDAQAFVLDPLAPCVPLTTNRGTLVIGR